MKKPSAETISEVMRHLSMKGARKGGIARAASLTAEERSAIAKKAGMASGLARRKLTSAN